MPTKIHNKFCVVIVKAARVTMTALFLIIVWPVKRRKKWIQTAFDVWVCRISPLHNLITCPGNKGKQLHPVWNKGGNRA